MTVIGILGGSGAVGRIAVERLATGGLGELRIGGRDQERTAAVCRAVRNDARAVPIRVDLHDPRSLRGFCDGCAVVLNCAGPSYRVLDTVARVALSVGAHYVDAAGDLVAVEALETDPPPQVADLAAVFSAGLLPGLSGLLPRLLTTRPLARLDIYVGGATRIGELSAVDALLTRGPRFGTALAAWRDGAVVPGALAPLRSVTLPGFLGRVHAWPFLSTEAARLAATRRIGELRGYTVYVTEAIPRALAAAWADQGPVDRHVAEVVAAAETDLAVAGPYYTMLFQATRALAPFSGPTPEPSAGEAGPRRLVLRTTDPYALSGVVAAVAVGDVLAGQVKPGARHAAECLDPAGMFDRLVRDPLVTGSELR